jgi:hypothetical protein
MNVRIRYKKTKAPNVLTSTKYFTSSSTGGVYRVDLYLDTMTYKILNVNKQVVIRSSQLDEAEPCTHIVTLRRQAKNSLKKLGVNFDVELRIFEPTQESQKEQSSEV